MENIALNIYLLRNCSHLTIDFMEYAGSIASSRKMITEDKSKKLKIKYSLLILPLQNIRFVTSSNSLFMTVEIYLSNGSISRPSQCGHLLIR